MRPESAYTYQHERVLVIEGAYIGQSSDSSESVEKLPPEVRTKYDHNEAYAYTVLRVYRAIG